ncbi:hypothetical protein OF83DRAFT_1147955 [Amylostereum chailletii]|nr:hypothetical protein OF83DRAFT_1147955 [Amylostereum chailletii]
MSSTALAPTHSTTFVLSDSFEDILRFFTLSVERWEDGFDTRREIFAWVATSRFYNPYRIMTPQNGTKSREMYQEFFAWNEERKSQAIHPTEGRDALVRRVQEEALVFFGRKEFDSLVKSNRRRIRLRTIWNGTKVGEWTEWSGWGRGVGRVMKHLRQTVGEDRIADMTEEEVKELVLEAKKVVEKEREAELATAEGPESLP